MKHFIYADNAATTKLDIDAFEAMKPFLLEDYGNVSQPYTLARKPKRALAEARAVIADCIGALPEEIFFTSGGTESDNWAIKGVVEPGEKHLTIHLKLSIMRYSILVVHWNALAIPLFICLLMHAVQ